jgi:hypothetical protein
VSLQNRTRRPVFFLGYGARGHVWLRKAADRIRTDPMLRDMMDARVIQFWSIGTDPAPSADDPIRWLDGDIEALGGLVRKSCCS